MLLVSIDIVSLLAVEDQLKCGIDFKSIYIELQRESLYVIGGGSVRCNFKTSGFTNLIWV